MIFRNLNVILIKYQQELGKLILKFMWKDKHGIAPMEGHGVQSKKRVSVLSWKPLSPPQGAPGGVILPSLPPEITAWTKCAEQHTGGTARQARQGRQRRCPGAAPGTIWRECPGGGQGAPQSPERGGRERTFWRVCRAPGPPCVLAKFTSGMCVGTWKK